MLFGSKQKKELKDLRNSINNYQETNKNLIERLSKLERIVEYSKGDKPNFSLKFKVVCIDVFLDDYLANYHLRLYIDKKEYDFTLSEIRVHNVKEEDCSIDVKGDLAYFNVNVNNKDNHKKYEFIIDYKNGKYILNKEIDMCKPIKM